MGGSGGTGRTSAECAEIAAAFNQCTSACKSPRGLLSLVRIFDSFHVRAVEMSSEEIASHIKESFATKFTSPCSEMVQPRLFTYKIESATDII